MIVLNGHLVRTIHEIQAGAEARFLRVVSLISNDRETSFTIMAEHVGTKEEEHYHITPGRYRLHWEKL